MKRVASSASSETKRTKKSPESNPTVTSLDCAPEQCPLHIVRHGVDQAGCILGRFIMIRSGEKGIETIASDSLTALTLSPHDDFRLSLHGVEMEKLRQTPKLSSLPLKLVYTKGVYIEWKPGGLENVRTVNTWLSDKADGPDDIWYGTPSATLLQSKGKQNEAPPQEEARPRQDKEDKKRQRMEAKRKKSSKATVLEGNTEVSGPKAPLAAVSCQNDAPQILGGTSSINTPMICPPEDCLSQLSGDLLDLQAVLLSEGVTYTALKDIQLGQIAHLVGIVISISEPSRTRNGDWMRFVHIVDPSNYHGPRGLKINCFSKKYKEWLPHPEWSHVLVLRNVKVVSFQDSLVGTGYGDKLGWAAFSPSTHSIYHGKLKDVPRAEGLAEGGFGVSFSPFYQPREYEVRYCLKLSDWWREVQRIEEWKSTKDTVDPVRNRLTHRIHRLISEAGPSVPPDGYFNCTVEVLKSFPGFNGNVHVVYVTDYTRNDQVRGVQSNWCPTSLSDFVLQMEMWDNAADIARTMREGDYYLINNARMRVNLSGYLEAKIVEPKLVQLQEKDASTNTYLQTLLERKKVLTAKQPDTEIAHQLIQDAEDSKFFHCTVELIHPASSTSDIYVTDYTSHPRLGIIAINEPWSKGLEKCLARIRLSEEQRRIVESVIGGSFCSIKKLRLKYSPTEECFRGFLGGTEKLIQVLNPNKTDNEHLNGLLRRREAWRQKVIQLQRPPSASPTRPTLTTPPRQSYNRIKDINPEDTGIRKYRIFAKAVDFYPLKLEDAFYQFCKRCKIEVPKSKQACFRCEDFEHEYLQYLYQLYLMVEDEDGKQIVVSINDECPLLEGLERVYIPDNAAAVRNFQERLKSLLGNLTMVHSALLSEKKIEIDTPFGVYELDSWVTPKDRRAFCLVRYDQSVVIKS